MKIRLLSASFLLAALPALAQGPGGHGPMMHGGDGPGFGGRGFGMRQPVTNAPYSATFTSTSTEKLQDGTVLTHTVTRVAARDSLGRTREAITTQGRDGASHTAVMILDPVAHTLTRLETEKKIAIVHQLPAARPHGDRGGRHRGPDGPDAPPPPADAAAGTQPAPRGPRGDRNMAIADLGSKTISGDVATGKRFTRTIPAGAMGNAAPIVSTRETWMSNDLQIELGNSDVDPFRGTRTTTVSGLAKAEPAADLFKAPSDYTVQQAPERAWGRGPRRNGDNPPPPPPPGM